MKKEKKTPGWVQRIVPPLIVLFLLIAIAGLSAKFLFGNPAPDIISNVLELRKVESTVKKADLIAETDDLVDSLNNKNINAEWGSLTACLSVTCSNADFLNVVQTVAYEEKIPRYELIINLVLTYKYWNSEEVVKFSKALTAVDKQLDELNIRVVSDAWKKIVECDGTCPNKAPLYFDLIGELMDVA